VRLKVRRTLAITECPKCKQTIRVLEYDGTEVAFDMDSGEEHNCWHVGDEVEILVLPD